MILIWGLSWPINKIGLMYMPAMTYIVLRLGFGMITMFIILLAKKKFCFPTYSDLPIILAVGIFQMGLMMVLSNYGLFLIGAGRATFLTFTTSIWIIPLSMMMRQKISFLEILSFIIGVVGVLLLVEPWKMDPIDRVTWLGNGILVGAAISWSIGILCARHMKWHRSALQLLPWQLLVATGVSIGFVYLSGDSLTIGPVSPLFMCSFLYTGSLSIAIGYWIMVLISKHLPPSVTSLGLLCVPVLSLTISSLFLKEAVTYDLIVAIAFIICGIVIHVFAERKIAKHKHNEII